jgi:hypothetical protein
VPPVRDADRRRGWAVFAGKLFIAELMSALLLASLRVELGEGFLFTSAVGHTTLTLKVARRNGEF